MRMVFTQELVTHQKSNERTGVRFSDTKINDCGNTVQGVLHVLLCSLYIHIITYFISLVDGIFKTLKNDGKIGPHTSFHELKENDVTLRFSQIRKYIVRDFDGRTFFFACDNFGHSSDWLERISLLWKFPT